MRARQQDAGGLPAEDVAVRPRGAPRGKIVIIIMIRIVIDSNSNSNSNNENVCLHWLRTNRVNTNGAAAKVRSCFGLGKKVCPDTFGEIKVGEREYPKSPSVNKIEICSEC